MADKDFVVKNGLVVNSTLIVANSGKVGVNTASPDAVLTVSGTANIYGNVVISGSTLNSSANVTLTGNTRIKNTVFIDTRLYVGNTSTMVTLTNPVIQAIDNFNGFVQISTQNLSQLDDACSDLLIYADNTNGLTYFNDLGLNNSRFDGSIHRVSANTLADGFILGETVVQSNSTGGVIATGIVKDVFAWVGNTTHRSVKIAVDAGGAFVNTVGANLALKGQTSGTNSAVMIAVQFGAEQTFANGVIISRRNYPFTIGKRTDGYLYQANAALTIGTTEGGIRQTNSTVTGVSFASGANTITVANSALLYPDLVLSGTNVPANTVIVSIANSTTVKISKATTGVSSGTYYVADIEYDAAGNPIIFHTNGMVAENEIGRFSGNGNLTLGSRTTSRSSKLTVAGAANVTGNAIIGGIATVANTMAVTGATTLANTLAVTGNATISNSMSVVGDVTFRATANVYGAFTANGAATMANTVSITGAVSMSNSLAVTGNTTINSNLAVGGVLTLTGNASLSNSISVVGNATFGNTVSVLGAVTLSNTASITGAITLSNTATIIGAVSMANNVSVNGTLSVTNSVTMSNTLTVTGAASMSNTLAVTGAATISANATINGNLALTGAASMSNTLAVTGAATFGNTMAVTNAASFANNVSVNGTITVLRSATISNSVSVTGNAVFSNTIAVTGSAALSNNITVTGNATFSNTMAITGATTIGNTLGVTGAFALGGTFTLSNSATVSSTLGVTGAATFGNSASFANNITVSGSGTFSNNVTISGTSAVSGNASFSGANVAITSSNVSIAANATIVGTLLSVSSNTTLSGPNTRILGSLLEVTSNTTFGGSTLSASSNATFSANVSMTGANVNISGTTTAQNINVISGIWVGNSTSYFSANSSGTGEFSGGLKVIGNLIVTGSTVSQSTTESQGDFTPSNSSLKLGNSSNRWILNSSDGFFSGNITPVGAGPQAIGNTGNRWNIFAGSVDIANSLNLNGTLTVVSNSQVFKTNNTITVLTIAGNGITSNTTISGNSATVSANLTVSAAELNVLGVNTYITSNTTIAGTNNVITANLTTTGANVRILGTNTSIAANATFTANVNILGANATIAAANTLISGNLNITGVLNAVTNSQFFKSNSTVTALAITGNSTVTNTDIGGTSFNVNTNTFLNSNVVVTANSQQFKSNSSVVAITISGNSTSTNTIINGNELDINATLNADGIAQFNANTTFNGILRTNANSVITGANLYVSANATFIGPNVNVTGTLSVGNLVVANTMTVTDAVTVSNSISVVGAATFGNSVVIAGSLSVLGATVSVNTATLDVVDKNITIARGTNSAILADGAGITIEGANATLIYKNATNSWEANLSFTPSVTNTIDIGGTNNRWKTGFFGTQVLVGNSTVFANLSSNSISVNEINTTNVSVSSLVYTANLNVGVSANVGSNVRLTTQNITVGNSTLNSVMNAAGMISSNGTLTSVQNSAGFFIANSIGGTNIAVQNNNITIPATATINIGTTTINSTFFTGGVSWTSVTNKPTSLASYNNDVFYANSTNLLSINGSANSATYLVNKTEGQLNANSATYLGAKLEGALNANSAVYFGGLTAANYANTSTPVVTTSVTVGNSTVNSALSTSTLSVNGVGVINSTAFIGTANNSNYLGNKAEGALNANSAVYFGGLTAAGWANNSTPLISTLLSVGTASGNSSLSNNAVRFNGVFTMNSTSFVGTSNNTVYAFGKSENQINANSAYGKAENQLNANSAYGKAESQLNANSAYGKAEADLNANSATYLGAKFESQLNANSALFANSATYLGNFLASNYYRSGGTDVSLADGGTNASLTASQGSVVYGTATGMAMSAVGTAVGQVLISNITGAPTWLSQSSLSVGQAANSTLLNGKAEGSLSVAYATNAGLLGNKAEASLSVAQAAQAANSTLLNNKTENNLSVAYAANAGLLGGKAEAALSVAYAANAGLLNNKAEASLSVLYAANAGQLNGIAASSYARSDVSDVLAGGIGIGAITAPAAGYLSVQFDVTAFASDIRLKNVKYNISDALTKVNSLNGVVYTFNELGRSFGFDDSTHVGVIAQEVEKVLPEVIVPAPFDYDYETNTSISGENYKTVKYEKIVALLIEAVKELSAKVETLENEIVELKK